MTVENKVLRTQIADHKSDYDKVVNTYVEVKDEVTDFIKKNPWASVAIAAGVGFLLARLLSGRKE